MLHVTYMLDITCVLYNSYIVEFAGKGSVEVHVIYNFYCFYMSKIQNITAFYRKVQ